MYTLSEGKSITCTNCVGVINEDEIKPKFYIFATITVPLS